MSTQMPVGYAALRHSERRPRHGARLVGPVDPNETIAVSLRLRRRPDAPALPDAGVLAHTQLGERSYLSRDDFAAHFGADPKDVDAVRHFATTHNLSVVEESIARRIVVVRGSAADLQRAFVVELGQWETGRERYRGRTGALHLPTGLADIVVGVFGLDDRCMARPHLRRGTEGTPAAAVGATPDNAITPLTPPEVAHLYGFPASHNGAGQTIAIFEFGGGFKPSDLQQYFNGLHIPMPHVSSVSIDGQPNNPGTDNYTTETLLDISVAGSVAPGAKIVVYFAPWSEKGWIDVVTTAVHDKTNAPSVISISYGWPENEEIDGLAWSTAAVLAVNETFLEAAALGVTVMVSSGDNGSGCGIGDGRAHVEYPGSDPLVTCCGGTTISNVSGLAFKEDVWDDNGTTGGGISDIFTTVPPWQTATALPGSVNDGHKGRGIPDVAGNADPASGYMLVQNGAAIGPIGGTSATAPLYAALAALMNADLGEPVGYLNPNLYAMPPAYAFRDINDGKSNATGGAKGYVSGPGWDACTGLGGINGSALETSLEGVGLPVALAAFEGRMLAAWKGIERDDRVFTSFFDGSTWTPQAMVAGIGSSGGPALAAFGGAMFMAWKGIAGDERIFWSKFNGTSWTPQTLVAGVGTSVGPRLAVLGNTLFMAWKGLETDQRIFFSTFNGTGWAPQRLVSNVATSVGPALCTVGDKLYMVWKGENGDQTLWWSSWTGNGFAPQQKIANVASSEGPSIAAYDGKLFAIWKGEFADQGIYYASFDGTAWTPQKEIAGVASSVGPGLAVLGNELVACWKGMLGDQGLYYASFNGSAWTPQKLIPGVGNSPDLLAAD